MYIYSSGERSREKIAQGIESCALSTLEEFAARARRDRNTDAVAVIAGELGRRYYGGVGCTPNAREAFKWLIESATAGLPSSQFVLSGMYLDEDGRKFTGTGPNLLEATRWMQMAHDQGFAPAHMGLAKLKIGLRNERIERILQLGHPDNDAAVIVAIKKRVAAYFGVPECFIGSVEPGDLHILLTPIPGQQPIFLFAVHDDVLAAGPMQPTIITPDYPSRIIFEMMRAAESGDATQTKPYVDYYDAFLVDMLAALGLKEVLLAPQRASPAVESVDRASVSDHKAPAVKAKSRVPVYAMVVAAVALIGLLFWKNGQKAPSATLVVDSAGLPGDLISDASTIDGDRRDAEDDPVAPWTGPDPAASLGPSTWTDRLALPSGDLRGNPHDGRGLTYGATTIDASSSYFEIGPKYEYPGGIAVLVRTSEGGSSSPYEYKYILFADGGAVTEVSAPRFATVQIDPTVGLIDGVPTVALGPLRRKYRYAMLQEWKSVVIVEATPSAPVRLSEDNCDVVKAYVDECASVPRNRCTDAAVALKDMLFPAFRDLGYLENDPGFDGKRFESACTAVCRKDPPSPAAVKAICGL